ncbi:MAG: hypothetical protein ACR2FO_02750 [Actinomycetota bacterium]
MVEKVEVSRLIGLKLKLRRTCMVLGPIVALAVLGACARSDGTDVRLRKVETSVGEVAGVASRVAAVETKEKGMSGQVTTLQSDLTDLKAKVEDFDGKVNSSTSATADLKKKADDLSSKVSALSTKVDSFSGRIGAVEQKSSLLQTRYDDHLRKYHSGG